MASDSNQSDVQAQREETECQKEVPQPMEEFAAATGETTTAEAPRHNKRADPPSPTTDDSEDPKRIRTTTTEEEKETTTTASETLDLAYTLGFQPGDRIEVEWQIVGDEDGGKSDEEGGNFRWWGATLLEHDGRTEDSVVAIRTLDYDPYPEGGFPERSREDVIFIGPNELVNHPNHDEHLRFRQVFDDGEAEESVWFKRNEIENVVNTSLTEAFQKNAQAWGGLSAAQQALIADQIASKKEKLMELLLNHDRALVTSSDMKNILAKTMEQDDE